MISKLNDLFLKEYNINQNGGKIYVDRKTAQWLDSFISVNQSQKSYRELKLFTQITKSGFNENPEISPPDNYPKISVILVLYNSNYWIDNLIKVFKNLSEWLHEIIVVDNGSIDEGLRLLQQGVDKLISIQNSSPKSFAAAINQGTRIATGDVFFIINPDVYIPRTSLWELIHSYNKNQNIAAISPKLLLMKTPGFINGIGNIVRPFWHGYDIGLGHLDVGQFNHIKELPSACFASIFIPKSSWELVGEVDEEYPMYYEDSDWCYRARNYGLKILFCSSSEVFHGYKSYKVGVENINSTYIRNISYGRIRFSKKNFPRLKSTLFLMSYVISDLLYLVIYWLRYQKNFFSDYYSVWKNIFQFKSYSINQNKQSKSRRMKFEKHKISFPMVFNGLPLLKWKVLIILNNDKKRNRNY